MAQFWATVAVDDQPIRVPARFAAPDHIGQSTSGGVRIRACSTDRHRSGGRPEEAASWKWPVGETTVACRNGELTIDIPFAASTCLFARREPGRVSLSNDPRLLARSDDAFDPRALYSVLQFGAIPPPFTMWRAIVQLTSGRVWTLSPALEWRSTRRRLSPADDGSDPEPSSWEDRLAGRLDRVLKALAPDERPVICFSGGVDSGILAARAARLGWRDTLLVHLSRGPGDNETHHAERMASTLGLTLVCLHDDPRLVDGVLSTVGATWYQPFGDCSVVSTARLASEILSRFPDRNFVLDGVGADGCFGLVQKSRLWQRIHSLPLLLRRAAARLYGRRHVYGSTGRMEHWLRVLTRAGQMPYPLAAVAQNALCGRAYHFESRLMEDVWHSIGEWADPPAGQSPGDARLARLDVGLTCSRMFAQKTRALFDASSLDIAHPYLASAVFDFALSTIAEVSPREEPKARLKRLLARDMPAPTVYRPKSGFPLAVEALFRSPSFLEGLDAVIAGTSTLTAVTGRRTLERLRQRLLLQRPLNWQAYNFLWTLVFTHLWMDQVRPGADPVGGTPAEHVGSERSVCVG